MSNSKKLSELFDEVDEIISTIEERLWAAVDKEVRQILLSPRNAAVTFNNDGEGYHFKDDDGREVSGKKLCSDLIAIFSKYETFFENFEISYSWTLLEDGRIQKDILFE